MTAKMTGGRATAVVPRGLDTSRRQFFDSARRYLSQQVRRDPDSPSLNSPYSNHLPPTTDTTAEQTFWPMNHSSEVFMSLQMYYDNTTIADNSLFVRSSKYFDMDFQHGFHIGDSQQFVWGLGYRSIRDRNDPSFSVSLRPNQLTLNHFSAFIQDEISLVDNRLRLTFGSKSSITISPDSRCSRTRDCCGR